ncbi:MAG: hypothetical protein ACREEB_00240 [Caulobacteraceae bacterium]
MPAHTIATLTLSLAALAFVVWLALVNPARESVYGPAPAAAAQA